MKKKGTDAGVLFISNNTRKTMKQISADTCGRMQREGADAGGGGGRRESKLDQTNRGVNSTSNARERRRRKECVRVRMYAGVGACVRGCVRANTA